MRAFIPFALLMATALGACSLQPKYVRPAAPVPPSWPKGAAYVEPGDAAALPSVDYRDIFRDPKLQAVIGQALANNRDLRIAAANVAAARGQYRVQRAERLPRIVAGADASVARTSGNGGGANGTSGAARTSDRYSVDLGMAAFEIDLFGRVRSLTDAALNDYFATEAVARTARLALVAETASAWLTLAADRSLLAIAEATEANAVRSVRLTRARLTGGIGTRIDLRQAETILATARADVASFTTQVAQDRNALELLVGAPVAEELLPLSIEAVDGGLAELPVGLDSRILLRRPDVAEAEFTLKAANARIGAARAAFFPSISLTAVAGFASGALDALFKEGAFNWSVAPSATLPIFDGGANRGNLATARAGRDRALAAYELTIQTAFREVADALARRSTIGREFAARSDLLAAASDNYRLSDARYRSGLDSFLASLDAQRTLYGAQQSVVAARLIRADNLVTLYRVLGGDARVEEGAFGPAGR
ncbi:transporter [Sphingomonas oleivorans]|uniref:Transporter n=2 Tax=Sphingomonas oleivorans TaxID=1735121 RepID=A0A2T5FY08_9SPHN|nr:efflux transporter outer membrane subunit [Sphingomonas oleivorans]PTQ10964.1 transporter [Sphingomonas oleivorans]